VLRGSLALLLLAGCGDDDLVADAGVTFDGGAGVDGGAQLVDAGRFDAGRFDAGRFDAGFDGGARVDAGARDAGPPVDAGDISALPLPDDIAISDVAAFQGMRVSLTEATETPLVAAKDALLRIYVSPEAGFVARELACWLTLFDGDERWDFVERARITRSSREGVLDAFVFELPGEVLRESTTFVVSLRDPSGEPAPLPATSDARYPEDGFSQSMNVEGNGGVDLVLVPIRYGFDGSGRLPDLRAPIVEALQAHLDATYPADVRIRVRDPYDHDALVDRNGAGFSQLVEDMATLRTADGAEDHEHYFGLVAPAPDFDAYCRGSCVTGQAFTAPLDTPSMHAGAGIWYGTASSRSTVLHELGHTYGMGHSPCGVTFDPDPRYPFGDGRIGDWGYDRRDRSFVDPSTADLMGYCFPQWLGGWSLRRLHDRIRHESGPTPRTHVAKQPHHVFADGVYRRTILERPATRGPMLEARDAEGRLLATVRAHEVPLAHPLPGPRRYLLIPAVEGATHFIGEAGVVATVPDYPG